MDADAPWRKDTGREAGGGGRDFGDGEGFTQSVGFSDFCRSRGQVGEECDVG